MSTPQDMAHCQCRNASGYPLVAGDNRGNVSHRDDHSVNKALPWIAFSWFLSGGAIIGLIIWSIVAPSLIDSRVEGRVGKAEAVAEQARKEAGIAKDMMDVERAKRIAREELKR